MLTENDTGDVRGRSVLTSDDEDLGTVERIYLDDDTGRPEFVTVRTGLFGSKQSFVPVSGATLTGETLTVPYTKDKVTGAPRFDTDDGHLDKPQERQLYEYYEMSYDDEVSDDLSDRGEVDPASLGIGTPPTTR